MFVFEHVFISCCVHLFIYLQFVIWAPFLMSIMKSYYICICVICIGKLNGGGIEVEGIPNTWLDWMHANCNFYNIINGRHTQNYGCAFLNFWMWSLRCDHSENPYGGVPLGLSMHRFSRRPKTKGGTLGNRKFFCWWKGLKGGGQEPSKTPLHLFIQ